MLVKLYYLLLLIVALILKGNLKDTYKDQYEKHHIHVVDNRRRIVPMEVKIGVFAVKLKISHDKTPEGEFRDEMRRHLKNLSYYMGDDINISQLIDENNRVTFVRGIAGMGKSVLAKQLTYGWANDTMYTNFKLCIMFECRDLNYFQGTEGAKFEKHEVFQEFLKARFNFNLLDSEGILFVVDGLDELYDINTNDSIIRQLVNMSYSKYRKSKIIITGRPHVEEKLVQLGNEMGGLRRLEIQGLNDEQIDDYISKFFSLQDNTSAINRAKNLSKRNLPILHVPQFLNSFCCVAILTNGEGVQNEAELYSWTLYLLLKQHSADKLRSSNKTVSDIIKEYSRSLLTLSKVCHNLLNENKIIFEGKIESIFDGTEAGKSFIESLFVDVSDNRQARFQFKHLSLMEFLAALFICNSKNPFKVIKENLEKGFIEVVSFACRLIAGFSSEGIIQEFLNGATLPEIKPFLKKIIKLLNRSELDVGTKFKRSITFMSYFLSNNFKDKKVIISFTAQLHFKGRLDVMDSYNLVTICNYLVRDCRCEEGEVRMAFKNVHITQFYVNELKHLNCVKYMDVDQIWLCNLNTSINAVRSTLKESVFGKCKELAIRDCRLSDEDEIDKRSITPDEALEGLAILRCKLNAKSFKNICVLGILSEQFSLWELDIRGFWWETLASKVEERNINGDLNLRFLEIFNCTTKLTEELVERVSRFEHSELFVTSTYTKSTLVEDATGIIMCKSQIIRLFQTFIW